MAGRSRYDVSAKGAGLGAGGVLKNKLGIKNQKELDDAETLLLADAYSHFFERLEKEDLMFGLSFLFEIHKFFLSTLYPWAGKTRRVNISKGDVLFAPAEHLEGSLRKFDPLLKKHLPSTKDSKKEVSQEVAFIHNELNVLHPFREGNGRTIRLFLDLIVVGVGYEPIDWKKTSMKNYIEACRKGMAADHVPMQKIVHQGLKKK